MVAVASNGGASVRVGVGGERVGGGAVVGESTTIRVRWSPHPHPPPTNLPIPRHPHPVSNSKYIYGVPYAGVCVRVCEEDTASWYIHLPWLIMCRCIRHTCTCW